MLKFVAAIVAMSFGAAHAQQVLVCDMNTDLGGSVISDQFVFRIDAEAGTAIVNDLLIAGTTGGPIVAEIGFSK